jgi:hypothetical protein
MRLAIYKCRQCKLRLRREQCVLHDDPMAPFGPELLCPQCEGLVFSRHHPGVLISVGVMITGLSVWLGLYLS